MDSKGPRGGAPASFRGPGRPKIVPRRPQDSPRGPQEGPQEVPRRLQDTILVRFGRLYGGMFAPIFYFSAILCYIRVKAQNYYFCSTRGPLHVFELQEILHKVEYRSDKKKHPRWSASIWSENRAPDVLQKRGNTPGRPKTPHNSPQYALKTAPRRPQTAPRRP